MRWSWVLVLAVVPAACERDFSVPAAWSGRAGSAGTGTGGRAGAAGSEPHAGGSAGQEPTAGEAGAVEAGSGGEAEGGSTGTDSGAAGQAGSVANGSPVAMFDFYRFRRGEDAFENQGGAGGDGDTTGAEGGAGGGAGSDESSWTYVVRPGSPALQHNDVDPEGEMLRVRRATTTTERGGSVTISEDGRFAYRPPSNRFSGNDYFEYEVTDGENESAGRVRVTLSAPAVRLDDVLEAGGNGWQVFGSESFELFGVFAGSAGDVNGDGLDDVVTAAPIVELTETNAAYVLFGRKETSPVHVADFERAPGSAAGFLITGVRLLEVPTHPVSGAGDLNGDGLGEVVIASYASATALDPSVYVLFGRRENTPISLAEVTPAGGPLGIRIDARVGSRERLGTSVAGAGDMNGDGYDELVIGAPGAVRGASPEVGAAYVLRGHRDFGKRPIELQDVIEGTGDRPGFLVRGAREASRAGFSVAGAGDVNGDGLADIVLGAPEQDPREPFGDAVAGSAYVVFGTRELLPVDLKWLEEEGRREGFAIWGNYTAALGYSVSGGGYVNPDALSDVLTGMPDYQTFDTRYSGGAYVAFGRTEPAAETLNHTDVSQTGYLVRGYDGGAFQGMSVAAGDFDGDGWSDAVITGNHQALRAYIAFGGALHSSRNLSLMSACSGEIAALCLAYDQLDPPRAPASGDFDGDGIDDVFLTSANALARRGSAAVTLGWDVRDRVQGRHVAFAGGAADDTIGYAGGEILRLAGGSGFDTVAVSGPGLTWDLRTIEPTRLESIERIDLSGSGDHALILDEAQVRLLPSTRRDLPSPLAKTLTVLGDAGDTLFIDLTNFDELGRHEGRRLFRRKDLYYGLEVDEALPIAAPPVASTVD